MIARPPVARLVLLRIASLPFEALEPLAAHEAATRAAALLDQGARLDEEVPRLTAALYAAAGASPGSAGSASSAGSALGARRAPGRTAVIAVRRAIHNRRPVPPAQLAALRGEVHADLAAAIEAHLAARAALAVAAAETARAHRDGLLQARRALLQLAGSGAFREGMRLVSRALLARLDSLADAGLDHPRHDERHAFAKLAAYAARFATKCSPNSVFCATALAWIGGGEARVAGANQARCLDVILSIAEARKIGACVGEGRAAWPAIVPRPNPTLRRAEGVWSFWRPSTLRNQHDDEVLCRAPAHPVAEIFLEEAGRGTANVPALLEAVATRSGHEAAALAPFFEQLAQKGILVAEIEPPYGCRRPLRFVAERMREAGAAAPWLPEIEAVEAEVDVLPALGHQARIAAMDRIETRLAALPHARPLRPDELFRVDAAAGIDVTLPARVLAEIEEPLRRCVRLFAAIYPEMAFRRAWAGRFLSRHPPDTDVPLLDLYHGLFEPEARHRPESFPAAPPGAAGAGELLARTREAFAARARTALAAGRDEVELTDGDWEEIAGGLAEPGWSAGVLFQVAARHAEDVTAGNYRVALNAFFGAGIALARFAHLHGAPGAANPIAHEVERSWQPLARDGAILAEITYNHFSRTANAGLRPLLFRHEIELPGSRISPGCEPVPLRELTVRWDAGEERFVLRWPHRGVEVIPVLSSGVSPEGFIQFLVEIGRQGLQPLAWFPGFDVPDLLSWPRFRTGKLVLFRRRWQFPAGAGPEPPPAGERPDAAAGAFFLATARWRCRHALPRHVFLHTTAEPKPFYADLDSPLSVDLLRRLLAAPSAAPPTLHVTEMLPGPEEMWVRDESGRYATEFLLHLSGP